MTFQAELFAHLNVAAITSYVGRRIFPGVIPEGEVGLPAITFSFVSGQPQNSLGGFTSGMTRYIVQIDCWGATVAAVDSLSIVVRDRMASAASTFRTAVTEFPLLDDYEPQTKRYRRSIACSCLHVEA